MTPTIKVDLQKDTDEFNKDIQSKWINGHRQFL